MTINRLSGCFGAKLKTRVCPGCLPPGCVFKIPQFQHPPVPDEPLEVPELSVRQARVRLHLPHRRRDPRGLLLRGQSAQVGGRRDAQVHEYTTCIHNTLCKQSGQSVSFFFQFQLPLIICPHITFYECSEVTFQIEVCMKDDFLLKGFCGHAPPVYLDFF